MKTTLFTAAIAIALAACQQSASPTNKNDRIDTGFKQTPTSAIQTQKPDTLPGMDTSRIVVDSMARISFNGTPVDGKVTTLDNVLYNNWLQAYQASKHLPAALKMTKIGTVMMGARGSIMDAIVLAQDKMKDYIAQDKFQKKFAQLTPEQQKTLQDTHAILFQKEF